MSPNAREPQTDREFLININDHVEQLVKDVTDIKEKMDEKTDINLCDRLHGVIDSRLLIHGKAIDKLENWRWYLLGMAVAIAFIIESVLQLVRK